MRVVALALALAVGLWAGLGLSSPPEVPTPGPAPRRPPPPVAASPHVISGLVITDEVVEAMAAFFRYAFEEAEFARRAGGHPEPSAIYLALPGETDPDPELLVLLADYHAHLPGPPYRRVLPVSERPWQSPEVAWTVALERLEWKGSEDDILFVGSLRESHGRISGAWSPEFLLTPPGRWVLRKS